MSYIHSRNVIHGDLRLSNIIMDDNGHISLIDFGLARYTGEDGLDFDLDYSCFGNILLYLLYSAYPKRGKKIWYEELDLLPGQRAYLMRLLRLTEPFTSDTAVVEGFRKNFSIN